MYENDGFHPYEDNNDAQNRYEAQSSETSGNQWQQPLYQMPQQPEHTQPKKKHTAAAGAYAAEEEAYRRARRRAGAVLLAARRRGRRRRHGHRHEHDRHVRRLAQQQHLHHPAG